MISNTGGENKNQTDWKFFKPKTNVNDNIFNTRFLCCQQFAGRLSVAIGTLALFIIKQRVTDSEKQITSPNISVLQSN